MHTMNPFLHRFEGIFEIWDQRKMPYITSITTGITEGYCAPEWPIYFRIIYMVLSICHFQYSNPMKDSYCICLCWFAILSRSLTDQWYLNIKLTLVHFGLSKSFLLLKALAGQYINSSTLAN